MDVYHILVFDDTLKFYWVILVVTVVPPMTLDLGHSRGGSERNTLVTRPGISKRDLHEEVILLRPIESEAVVTRCFRNIFRIGESKRLKC